MKSDDHILVAFTTLPDADTARAIARSSVEKGLAACTQISGSPCISHYVYNGEMFADEEYELKFKFHPSKRRQLEELVFSMHPYDCPQWYCIRADFAAPDYADWVSKT